MSEEEESNKKLTSYYKEVGPYLGVGLQLTVTVAGMFFLGRWLDSLTGTEPLLTLLFALFGIAAGIYNFIKTVLALSKSENENRK
jgi:F0F1-type ATP synthase assembly protein I